MKYEWRQIVKREPAAAVPQIEDYAFELDAIDVSVRKTLGTLSTPMTISPFGWGDQAGPGSLKAVRRPIVPVVADDQAKLAVAILQRLHFCRRAMFFGREPETDLGVCYVLLAMADRVMGRKLVLSPSTASDLVEVLLKTCEYLAPAMKQIERSFSPPVPAKLRVPLRLLHKALSTPVPKCSWKPRSPMIVPKRNQNMCRRIERLLGTRPPTGGWERAIPRNSATGSGGGS